MYKWKGAQNVWLHSSDLLVWVFLLHHVCRHTWMSWNTNTNIQHPPYRRVVRSRTSEVSKTRNVLMWKTFSFLWHPCLNTVWHPKYDSFCFSTLRRNRSVILSEHHQMFDVFCNSPPSGRGGRGAAGLLNGVFIHPPVGGQPARPPVRG